MSMKRFLMVTAGALAALTATNSASAQPGTVGGYPADAQPGQCFARVLIPEVAETVAEQVIDVPERTEIKVIPAQYQMVDEVLTVRESRTEFRVIPATYRTVTETVVVEPERTEQVVVPASTETVTERIMVRPAYTTWKPGAGVFGRGFSRTGAGVGAASTGDGAEQLTGELLCRVEVPAEYRNVTRTRVVNPESTQARIIPAKTQTVTKEVIATPARVEEVTIPAETRAVKVRKMVTPPREERIVIPASFRTVEKRVVKQAAGVEWREVLCETNTSPAKIAEIQNALTARGFAVPATGQFGPQTLAAMEAFQRRNGLPVGNLTIDTARALGVSPR
jgi:hypothetical protein